MGIFARLGFLVLLSGCAGAPVAEVAVLPDWVEHPDRSYPKERYLTSVGMGVSREEAVRDARRQMAEFLQTRIQTVTRVRAESNFRQDTGGSQAGTAGQEVSRESTFESDVRLRGAEVRETAERGSQHYALLALDKLSARSALLIDATRVRNRISALLDSLENSHQVQKWDEAKQELARLNEISSEAGVLGAGALVETASLESRFQTMESALRARNSKRVFAVQSVRGEEEFSRGLESCLQDQGATVVVPEKAGETAHRIQVEVWEHPEHFAVEGWTKIRYEVTARIQDPSGRSWRITEQKTETARSREAGLGAVVGEISKNLCQKAWGRIGEMK